MADTRKNRKQGRQEDLEELTVASETSTAASTSETVYMVDVIKTLMEAQHKADSEREDRREKARRVEEERLEKAKRLERNEMLEAKKLEEERLEDLRLRREREAREHVAQLQKEAEERQFQQQVQLLKLQKEMGEAAGKVHREAAAKDRKQDRALTNIACCSEEDDLEDYLMMLERRLESATVNKEEWADVIESKLKGRLAIGWQDAVNGTGGYQEARDRFLKGNGYTPRVAADKFFGWKVEQTGGLTVDQLYQMGQQLSRRMLAPGRLSEELEFNLVKGWLGSVIPRQARAAMDARGSENAAELTAVLQDYLALGGDGKSATFKKYNSGVKEVNSSRPWQPSCFKCGRIGHKAADCWGGGPAVPRSEGAPVAGGSPKIVCHTCGVEGHKSPQCPRRGKGNEHGADAKPKPVRQVTVVGRRSEQSRVAGTVDGQKAVILLDTASEVSVVPSALVKEGQVVEEQVLVQGYGGSSPVWLPMAEVEFTLGDIQWSELVAVEPEGEGASKEVLLSLDLRSPRGIQIVFWANRDRAQKVERKGEVKVARVTTRNQASEKKGEDTKEEEEVIECTPEVVPVVVNPVVPNGHVVINEPGTAEVQSEILVENEEVLVDLVEPSVVEEGGEISCVLKDCGVGEDSLVVPHIQASSRDRAALAAESLTKPTLEGWPDLGDLAVNREEDVSFGLRVDGSCEGDIIVPPVNTGTLARAALAAEACELRNDEILDGFSDLFEEEEIDEEDEILDGCIDLFAEEEVVEEEMMDGLVDLLSGKAILNVEKEIVDVEVEDENILDDNKEFDVVLENDNVLDSLVNVVAKDAEEIVSESYDSSVGKDVVLFEKDTLCFGMDSSDYERGVEIVEANTEKDKPGKVEGKAVVGMVDVDKVDVDVEVRVESKTKVKAKVEANSAVGDVRIAEVKVGMMEEIVKGKTLDVRKWCKVKDEYFDCEIWLKELKKELPVVITAGPGRTRFGMPKIKGQPRACLGSVVLGGKSLVEFIWKFGAELAGHFVFLVAWKFIMAFAWKLVFMVAWKWLFMIVWKMVVMSTLRLMFELQELFLLPTSATSQPSPSVVVWDGARLKAFYTLIGMLCDVCVLTIPSSEDVCVFNLQEGVLKFLDFHLEIVYRPGSANGDGDGLSRQEWCNFEESVDMDDTQLRAAALSQIGGDVGTETPQMLGVATSGVALQEKSSVQERQCAK